MTMGPEPMMRMEWMSVRRGIFVAELYALGGRFQSRPAPPCQREPLARAEHLVRLPEPLALGDELVARVGGVELEHLVVTGDDEPGADVFGEPGGVAAGHVADLAVDREHREVDVV